jgi:hypothetical protein
MKTKTFLSGFVVLLAVVLAGSNWSFAGFASPIVKKASAITNDPATSTTDTVIDFQQAATGALPPGWTTALTGKGKPCRWEIVRDHGEKVLAQLSSETPDYRFNLAINQGLKYKNMEISVKFKGIRGHNDQGGGPLWRYQDASNYYVVRANPLENNFRLYKVVNGSRHMLKSANLPIDTGKWYTLKITMQGNHIVCYFNGKPLLKATDNTFSQAGKIGLWTKSDAVTFFKDLRVSGL